MSSINAMNIACETMRGIDAATIPNIPNFIEIGTPLEFPARMNIISNFSNIQIFISFDGINPHIPIAPNTSAVLDWSSNRSDQAGVATLAVGTQFWVTGGPGIGTIYISSVYVSDNKKG